MICFNKINKFNNMNMKMIMKILTNKIKTEVHQNNMQVITNKNKTIKMMKIQMIIKTIINNKIKIIKIKIIWKVKIMMFK